MEHVRLILDDGSGAEFDNALKNTLPDGGDLSIITKDKGTVQGNPLVMLTFSVELPDGKFAKAQTVTTARMVLAAARAIRGKYGDL